MKVAILARSSREMSLTVCTVWQPWQYILSWVCVSIRPNTPKTSINYHESRPSRIWLLNGPAAPVTMRSAMVTVEWPAIRRCIDTTAVILSRTDWPKRAKINQSKRRQWEFIPSQLEQCGLILLRGLCVCSVCVKINNEELFLMLSFLKIHIILVLDRRRCW